MRSQGSVKVPGAPTFEELSFSQFLFRPHLGRGRWPPGPRKGAPNPGTQRTQGSSLAEAAWFTRMAFTL